MKGVIFTELIRFLEAPTEQVIASLRSLPDEEVHWFLDQFPPAELGDRISTLQANNHYLLHSLRAVSPDQGDFDLAVNRLEVPRIVCVGYWGGASFPTRMVGSLLVDSIYTQSNPDLSGDNTPRIPCAFLLDQRLEHHLQPTFFCSPKNKEAQADYQIAVYCGGPNLFRLKSGMGRVQLQRFLEGFSQVILGKLDLFTLGEMESLMTDLDVLGLPMPSQVIGRTDGATYAGDEHPFWIPKKPAGEGGWHVSTGSFSNALPYIEDKPAPKWAGNYSRQASWPGELWRSLPGYLRQRLWRLLSSVAGWK